MYIPRRSAGSLAVQLEFKMSELSDLRKLKYGVMVGAGRVS